MDPDKAPGYDPIAEEFETYEDYLDSQINGTDMYYLENIELARQLVELGIRGNGEVIKREEFEQRKAAAEAVREARLNRKPKKLASQGKDLTGCPLLQALRDREEAVRNGKLCTIIFIRDRNARGQEVSGYIDYGHRLAADGGGGMEAIFARKKRLMPRPTDLSFYNWETHLATANPTPNFQAGPCWCKGLLMLSLLAVAQRVMAEDVHGVMFKSKRDRKVIDVDPRSPPGDNSSRSELATDEYTQVVLYDHVTRRRA